MMVLRQFHSRVQRAAFDTQPVVALSALPRHLPGDVQSYREVYNIIVHDILVIYYYLETIYTGSCIRDKKSAQRR